MNNEQDHVDHVPEDARRSWTANRRDVLKAASGLMAAVAIGGVTLQGGTQSAMAANANSLSVEIPALGIVFDAQSLQWGLGRGISSPTGGSADREASAPSVSEIVLTKRWDHATAVLLGEATYGEPLDVKLVFTDAKGGVAGTIALNGVLFSGLSMSYGGDLTTAGESLSLNFTKIEVVLHGQRYGYDLATGKAT